MLDLMAVTTGGNLPLYLHVAQRILRDLRVDRYEREFQLELNGMPQFQPTWAKESDFLARLNEVPV